MRRTALVVLYFLLVAMAATASPALAQPAPPAAADPSDVGADFNRDGFVDLAVGVPGEDGAAGAVNVLYGAGGGLSGAGSQVFTQVGGMVETGDRFGSALAAGDFNRDGFADLAAGAPFEAVGTVGGAGAVSVLYGSAGGLTAAGGRLFTQAGGAVETGDQFGAQLATGDFNRDGFADLAAAAPLETIGDAGGAGAVSVLYGSAGGLTAIGGQLFTQNSPGIPGVAEEADRFGGVPLET